MQDITYTPKRQNAIPAILVSCTTVVLVICAVFLMLEIGKPLIFQTVFIVAAVLEVFFFSRFMSSSYTYTIGYEQNVFIVTQKTGRRISTLCRLNLTALYRIRPYEKDDEVEKKHSGRYNYCVSFRPAISYLAFFDDGEHIVSIHLELDDTFYRLLTRIAEDNADRKAEEESDEDVVFDNL